jgi:hypothetical protein
MQGMLEKYQITFDDIRPNGWPKDETPLPHQTTITDNFNRANQAQLGTSSEGWSWSALSGELDIVSNTAQVITTPGVYRADSDLSSSDHYSQADTIARSALSSQGTAVFTRKDSSSTLTYYFGRLQGTGSDVVRLFKSIANVATQLGSDGAVTVSLPQSIKQTCNGSTISVDYAGVNKISLTDTSITTNTRTGLRIADNSVAASMDNFQASDLSVAGVLYTQLERSTRGLGRGMYQHF